MTEGKKKNIHKNGKEMISIRSRYCARCDAKLKWDCKCPNHLHMAWQRKNVFHSGKRYKGKKAWQKVYSDEIEYKKGDSK